MKSDRKLLVASVLGAYAHLLSVSPKETPKVLEIKPVLVTLIPNIDPKVRRDDLPTARNSKLKSSKQFRVDSKRMRFGR